MGSDRSSWDQYDASVLLATQSASAYDDILIDVGTADNFLKGGQLLPEVRIASLVSDRHPNCFFVGVSSCGGQSRSENYSTLPGEFILNICIL